MAQSNQWDDSNNGPNNGWNVSKYNKYGQSNGKWSTDYYNGKYNADYYVQSQWASKKYENNNNNNGNNRNNQNNGNNRNNRNNGDRNNGNVKNSNNGNNNNNGDNKNNGNGSNRDNGNGNNRNNNNVDNGRSDNNKNDKNDMNDHNDDRKEGERDLLLQWSEDASYECLYPPVSLTTSSMPGTPQRRGQGQQEQGHGQTPQNARSGASGKDRNVLSIGDRMAADGEKNALELIAEHGGSRHMFFGSKSPEQLKNDGNTKMVDMWGVMGLLRRKKLEIMALSHGCQSSLEFLKNDNKDNFDCVGWVSGREDDMGKVFEEWELEVESGRDYLRNNEQFLDRVTGKNGNIKLFGELESWMETLETENGNMDECSILLLGNVDYRFLFCNTFVKTLQNTRAFNDIKNEFNLSCLQDKNLRQKFGLSHVCDKWKIMCNNKKDLNDIALRLRLYSRLRNVDEWLVLRNQFIVDNYKDLKTKYPEFVLPLYGIFKWALAKPIQHNHVSSNSLNGIYKFEEKKPLLMVQCSKDAFLQIHTSLVNLGNKFSKVGFVFGLTYSNNVNVYYNILNSHLFNNYLRTKGLSGLNLRRNNNGNQVAMDIRNESNNNTISTFGEVEKWISTQYPRFSSQQQQQQQ